MKKPTIFIVFLSAFLIVTKITGMAQEWTLEKVIQKALQVSPQLQSMQNRVKAKEGARRQAAAVPNPDIGGITGNRSQMLSLGQQLEYPGKRGVRVKQAQQELDIARLELQANQLEVIATAASLFINLLWAQKNQNLRQENLQVTQKFLQAAQEKFDQGFGSKLDVIKGQVERLRANRLFMTARQELLIKQSALKLLLNQSMDESLILEGSLEQSVFTPGAGLDSLLSLAYRKNPILLTQQHRLQIAQLAIQAAHLSNKPNFNFDLTGGIEDEQQKVEFELRIPLALWDRKKGAKAEAFFLEKSAEKDGEAVQLDIRQEITTAYQNYENAKKLVVLFQDSILKEAKSAAEMAQQAFETSSFRFLDLIDAQRTYLDAASEYEQSRLELRLSEIELIRSIGTER